MMRVVALADDGTRSDPYDVHPTSPVGYKHRGARAGDVVEWMGIRYQVVEDNHGGRIT